MRRIALFPLNIVLFPGSPLRLHIFEPRYLQLVRDCLQKNSPFGVCLIQQGQESFGSAIPQPVGCTARILHVNPLQDGTLQMTVIGDDRFRILTLLGENPYLTAEVETYPMEKPYSLELITGARQLSRRVTEYLQRMSPAAPEGVQVDLALLPEEPVPMLYKAAALLMLPPQEKQDLLTARNAIQLLQRLQKIYERELALLPWLLRKDDPGANSTLN